MITPLVRVMSTDQILKIMPGTKIVLRNNESRHPNYPLKEFKMGDVFVVESIYYDPELIYPAIIVKGLFNPYERGGRGGFCSSRFGLWKNPRLYSSGGNI